MLVGELIEMLEQFDEDAEVRLAEQPRWAFEYDICDVVEVDLSEPNEEDEDFERGEPRLVVYIVEGNQLNYLPGVAQKAIGWKE